MDLNDSFTETLHQRSKARKEYLRAKMNVACNTNSRKRSVFVEESDQKESPKKQRLNLDVDNEKENAHIGAGNLQNKSQASSNVKGLATTQKKNTTGGFNNDQISNASNQATNKCEIRISSVSSSQPISSHPSRPSNLTSKIQQWEHQQEQDHKQSSKFLAKPFIVSQREEVPKKDSELASVSLSTRKAFFEKTSSRKNIMASKATSPSKLSFAQRAAMFENATNKEEKCPENVSLLKRVTPSAFKEAFECEQEVQDGSFKKKTNISGVKSSGFPTYQTTSMKQPEPPISENNNPCTSYTKHQFSKSSSTGLNESLKGNKKDEVTNTAQKVKPASDEICLRTNSLKKIGIDVNNTDLQHQAVESSITNAQQAEAVSKVSHGNEISSLLNHWEKLASSSSLAKSNSMESITMKSEKSNPNANISESEHSDCRSEQDWDSTEGESASEWEYIKGESISENPSHEKDLDPAPNQEVAENVPESVKDSRVENTNGETMEDSNATAIKEESMNETAGFVELPDEFNNFHGTVNANNIDEQNWQKKVHDNTQSSNDNSPCNLIPTDTDSCDAKSPNPKTSPSQTHSSTVSMRSNKTQDSLKTSIGSFGSPLVHTVSFYRKQKLGSKLSSPMTPVKRPMSPTEEGDTNLKIRRQIKLLQEEIIKQQNVIGQTSQALNLCYATTEFSGSLEKIEAERLLLIATQKRMACMNEIHYLKSQGEANAEGTGTLTISDIQLPLKQDYITSQMKGDSSRVHYFLCLIRHGAQVIVSQMASTNDRIMNGALHFYNHFELQKLSSDFSVSFEVYTLQSHKENLPHDKKYHIKREHSKIRLTPKGKKSESRLLRPAISSPGGPDAVRTSNFALIGYTKFTVQNSNKKCFTLDKVLFTSPLEGTLKANLHLQSNHTTSHKGFLTLFQDISDYGHWTRLWCSLGARGLSYWQYPDQEEQKKLPAGSIDLEKCVTGRVDVVTRDECARPNTFKVMTARPAGQEEKETLVNRMVNTVMTTKYLLSADTKEERIEWCNKINEALSNIRKWNAHALQPLDRGQMIV